MEKYKKIVVTVVVIGLIFLLYICLKDCFPRQEVPALTDEEVEQYISEER